MRRTASAFEDCANTAKDKRRADKLAASRQLQLWFGNQWPDHLHKLLATIYVNSRSDRPYYQRSTRLSLAAKEAAPFANTVAVFTIATRREALCTATQLEKAQTGKHSGSFLQR